MQSPPYSKMCKDTTLLIGQKVPLSGCLFFRLSSSLSLWCLGWEETLQTSAVCRYVCNNISAHTNMSTVFMCVSVCRPHVTSGQPSQIVRRLWCWVCVTQCSHLSTLEPNLWICSKQSHIKENEGSQGAHKNTFTTPGLCHFPALTINWMMYFSHVVQV